MPIIRYLLDYWWIPTTPGLVILFMALGRIQQKIAPSHESPAFGGIKRANAYDLSYVDR